MSHRPPQSHRDPERVPRGPLLGDRGVIVAGVAVTLAEMLELEVLPEHGLCSDQIEFILGE